MIPNGLNPHGLEDRKLTFSVLENNSPVFTCESPNGLYCWATFPSELVDYLSSMYQVPASEVKLTTEIKPD